MFIGRGSPWGNEFNKDVHALIRRFINILTLAIDKLETAEGPPKEFFEKAVAFARNFADRFHHYKEEHVMFAQLAEKKGGLFDGPVCIMLPSV